MTASPTIDAISWGTTRVEDHGEFKDAKLWPGGARAWDWNETGTSHDPGIQPADVEELVDAGAETVVLSRGMNRRLQVMDRTLQTLESEGVTVHVLETKQAVERYNELAAGGEPVGALIHSTC